MASEDALRMAECWLDAAENQTESAVSLVRQAPYVVVALAAEVRELRRDKARLDWLEKYARSEHGDQSYSFPIFAGNPPGWCIFNNFDELDIEDMESLREAIDAAMGVEVLPDGD